MSLIQSAKLNGLDPYAYLKDVLQRLPTQNPRTKRVSWGSCCRIAGRQATPPRGKASTPTYLSRIQAQSKGLPASWRVPLSIAKYLPVLDSVNDDTIDSKP